MAFFLVTLTHPDGDGWNRHLAPHVEYLKELVKSGALKAAGPLKGTPQRAGFLIFSAVDREAVNALVQGDPFAAQGVIESISITEWDPLFGAFADESSGELAGLGQV